MRKVQHTSQIDRFGIILFSTEDNTSQLYPFYTPPQHRLTFSLVCKMLISGAAQYIQEQHFADSNSPQRRNQRSL